MAGAIDFYGKTFRNSRRVIEAKTGNYTLTPADNGKIFTNQGATGAIVFTLPTPADHLRGVWYEFFVIADYSLTVTCTESIVADDNVSADSVGYATTDEMIGGSFEAICTGTAWIVKAAAYDTMSQTVTDA